GEVDLMHGPLATDDAEVVPPLRRQRIDHAAEVVESLERRRDPPLVLPAGELGRLRIQRHDASVGVPYEADLGVGHLAPALVDVDLAEERRLGAGGKLSGPPAL